MGTDAKIVVRLPRKQISNERRTGIAREFPSFRVSCG